MKKRSLLLGLISLVLAFSANSQIVTKYQLGFEPTGENYGYTVVEGTATPVTTLASSGSRSLKMTHTVGNRVIIELDTIDFSDNGSFQHFYLEFMHICDVDANACPVVNQVATIEVRRIDESSWTQLDANNYYDMTWGGGSDDYSGNSSFSDRSYASWTGQNADGTMWKRERFKLANRIQSAISLSDRKLIIRFILTNRRPNYGATNQGWYLDNIRVQCSPSSMLLPVVTMIDYPDMMEYPTSRGTHIKANFNTLVPQGMCQDSVYVDYQLGASAPMRRKVLTPVPGQAGNYETYLPFCGYDTVVRWHLVGMDNTVNHNRADFPSDESGWQEYRNVRGKSTNTAISIVSGAGNITVPFPSDGSSKTESAYAEWEMAGTYGPGAITQIRYPVAANVNNSNHQNLRISMRNLPSTFSYSQTSLSAPVPFSTAHQKVVYDSSLSITQNNGTYGTINLQDTFFYAGHGLMVTFTNYNQGNNPPAVMVRTFPATGLEGGSLTQSYPASYNMDPVTSSFFINGNRTTARPNFIFKVNANAPLLYDCGISGFINPNDTTPANAVGDNDVIVTLKNYGSEPINSVRIYYSVDNGTHQYYDWSGTLAGGATTNVTINTTQQYPAGYHEMLAWVDDSVISAGSKYRDHEPLNDTLWTKFVSCNGPMSGVRTVGGSTPDYQSLEKMLYALSQCGVNGPLTVKLAPGSYTPHTFPSIPGTSATNYIQFEPLGGGTVQFVSDVTAAPLVNSLVNLQQTNHIRFKNIYFWSNAASNPVTYLVRMGTNSLGCQFLDCDFSEVQGGSMSESYMAASALLYSGGADSLVVRGCRFNRGTTGVSLVGPAQDNMARGSRLIGNSFTNQGVNSMVVRNQIDAVVDSNNCDKVYANSSYAILLQDCSGASRVTRNTVYVTSGAACIGATGFLGYPSAYSVIANNMLVSNDDGTSNMLTTPLNIINASYTKILYNSVKMTAPTRNGIAAATFGGSAIGHSYFYNNIASCFDTVNFAFNYIPTEDSVNYIGYNIYYSQGPLLNKYDGINCLSLANWQTHCGMDANSQNVNPSFLNSTLTDLRSYSQNVKAHGAPFAEVDDDIFGTDRDSVSPCVGAFEFSALPYDFEIIDFVEPFAEYCDAPGAAPLRVVIKNSGVNAFNPANSNMQLTYSRNGGPGSMTPGFSGNIPVNITIPALDTITFNTGVTIPFPTNGTKDSTYRLYLWLTSTIDPNPANDTSMTSVTARYHSPAPNSISINSNYGSQATVTATGGIETWYSNVYTAGASHQSEVYWYTSPSSDSAIWRGNTYITDMLYNDTTFYIRQKRDYPLVKITEVQFKQNQPGVTYPMPLWMNSATTLAVELTNIGDYPANMMGDTLFLISSTNTYNNKNYIFPDLTIQPGESLVIQYRTGINNVDSSKTVAFNGTVNPNQSVPLAFIYSNNGVIEDAVAFNDILTHSRWTDKHVPTTVWAGNASIQLPDSIPTAGVFRTGWPTNPSNLTFSATMWQKADANTRMTIGKTNANLVRFVDNGCIGDVAPVQIHLINLPDVDVAIEEFTIDDGCGMGQVPISMTVRNRGSQPSGQLVLKYNIVGHPQYPGQAITLQNCSDTIATGIPATGVINHTFSAVPDFTVATASVDFDVTVWAVKNNDDNTQFNDTVKFEVTSMFTPDTANVIGYDTVVYDHPAILTSITPPADSLAWYDRNMSPLDTTNLFVSDILYEDDTFYVSAFGAKVNQIHVGNMASLSPANNYPSPYNPRKKYVKEQYLYTADELRAAGHEAGPIQTVAFYLDTILAPSGNYILTDYTISLGTTSQATFTSNSNWLPVTPYYSADTIEMSNSSKGWIMHTLDSSFMWNGVDNIVVQIVRTANPTVSQGARTRYTANGNNKVLYKNDDNSDMSSFTGTGSRSANHPDIRFGFVDYGCEGPAKPVYITIVGVPDQDGALSWSDMSYGGTGNGAATFNSCDTTHLTLSLRNMGLHPINSYSIQYSIDTLHGVYNGTEPVPVHSAVTLNFADYHFTPGRHQIKAILNLSGDTVQSNDTISRIINVRFCGGTYTIGSNGMYPNLTTAIDTLHNAGIDSAIVFAIQSGTYVEQLELGAIDGSSFDNTVTFQGTVGSPENVVIRFAPTNTANYVFKVDGSQYVYFDWLTFLSRGANNFSNVVSLSNSDHVYFRNSIVRVKGNLNNANASGIIVGEGVSALYVQNCWLDSGYYSIRSMVSEPQASQGIYVTNNRIEHFFNTGVQLRKVDDVHVVGNHFLSAASSNSKALTGVFVAQHNGPVTIERNNIVLADNFTGGKMGVKIVNVDGANATRSHISNNMCAMYGTGNAGQTSVGIFVDSSTWVNVYYNSVNVFAGNGTQGQASRAMSVGTTSMNVYIMNNIFSNISAGYALYVQNAANVENSNYNNYYSSAEKKLAYWGGVEDSTFVELQQTNQMDNNSTNKKPYFISDTNLHLSIGSFCELAQYSTEVPTDIDEAIRPQIPNPCMGAHEFIRKNHNIAVMEIVKPQLKKYSAQLTGFTDNIESDTLNIVVKFTNDGTSTESNLTWWAEVKNTGLSSSVRTIEEMLPQSEVVDSNYIVMPIGIIDTQIIVIHFPLFNDSVPENNVLEGEFFLDPAYNFMAEQTLIFDTACRLQQTPIGIKLKNVGRKDFPAGWSVPCGFQAILQTTGLTVPTLPVVVTENIVLPTDVPVNGSIELNFQQTANLYPTANDKDIVVRARVWSSHQYDQKPLNDTSNYVNHSAYYTPNAPVGIDLHIPYATWDTIFASQTDLPPGASPIHRPIRWHRDSADVPYYASNNYNLSTYWVTPQYFHDSTYYLSCLSAHNNGTCTSYYNPVHVYLNPRVPVDMAVLDVVEPIGNRVYMNYDSVKISLINYGTQAMTNIPVVYQLYDHSNNLMQEVHEVCTATIQPDEVYVYRFDSLISIPSWSTTQAYHLRVWTDLANEGVRLNDTLRNLSYFYAVPDAVYPEAQVDNKPGLDIVRVSYGSLDNTVSPSGNSYINFINASMQNGVINNPAMLEEPLHDFGGKTVMQGLGNIRALHLTKGTVDTMTIEVRNSDNSSDFSTRAWMSVWIDVNRDGSFEFNPLVIPVGSTDSLVYDYPYTEAIHHDSIVSGIPYKFLFSLPEDVRTGYMRMRIVVAQSTLHPIDPTESFQFGQVQDYLLYVEDNPVGVDACAAYIVSPREQHIGGNTGYTADSAVTVTFRLFNKGSQPITAATVNYTYINQRYGTETGTLQWNGALEPGHGTDVELPSRQYTVGVTDVIIGISVPGDTITFNDTLIYQYYRAPIKRLVYSDNFEGVNEWFIPRGYTAYDQNVWQRGKSNKPNIMASVSDSCILATNISGLVNVFNTGNVSYAYTPIFDISTIRPDTLSLWVARDMAQGHLCRIEFCDYLGKWRTVGTGNDTLWYNSGSEWDTVSAGYGYNFCRFSLNSIGGDFQQRLQLRLVYKAESGSNACDGVAIDDFVVGRAVRNIDLGVIAITYPTHPRFGQIINPRVVVKNFGLDTIHDFELAYLPYGVNLARTGNYHSDAGLLPGSTDIYEFPTPFVVRNDFPDTFQICAYTRVNMDMYSDNDSICSDFYLSPLENDMGMVSILNPLTHVIAGDSIEVTTRIRNFGQSEVPSATVTYIYNESYRVTEEINFANVIGDNLQSFEYLNYTFKQKFRASMGHMNLMTIVHMDNDDYPFNDTLFMNFEGLSAITDLKAVGVVVDTSNQNVTKMQVIVENAGARAVNDFKIGFWYYRDTNTRREIIYHAETPLPALSTLYYKFADSLVPHTQYYKFVTAYVYTEEDNDRTNDTTTNIINQYYDLSPVRVVLEENREDSCRVRVEIANLGNCESRYEQAMSGTVYVNGFRVRYRNVNMTIQPGMSRMVDVPARVPKSPTRTYEGSVTLESPLDANMDNNQSTRVDVINYFDGVPVAPSSNGMLLHQNYPNPFEDVTRIDFYLPTSGTVRFFVMDELGRLVYQKEQDFSNGEQSINFRQNNLSTGVYYYGIEMDGERMMRKMVLKR